MTILKKFVLNRWPTKVIFDGFSSSGASNMVHFTQNVCKLGWLTFTQRVQYHVCVMVFKSLNGQAPEYLSNLLTKCSETNVRSLRSSKQETLKVPFARTTYYEKSFSVTGPELWNSLPIQIRQSSNLIKFKQSVKSFYLGEQLNDP